MFSRTRAMALASLLSFVFCWPLCCSARADLYSLRNLGGLGDREEMVAGDDFGDYTLQINETGSGPCMAFSGGCFFTSFANGSSEYTASAPSLPGDPGARAGNGCDSFTMPKASGGHYLCTNGHEIFVGTADGPQGMYYEGIWDGGDVLNDRIFGGADAYLVLTPNGSVYFDDESNDQFHELVNLGASPTPEPSSLLLTGSGLLASLGWLRRRRAAL